MLRSLIIGLAVLIATPASAQPPPPTAKREKVKQKIRALRAYTLTEQLALDEPTAARLFPILAKWDDVTDRLLGQRLDLTRQLAAATDPRATNKLIDDALANQRALSELEEKRIAELRKILTPVQTARLMVVLPQFERRIRNQLERAIQKAGGKRAKRHRQVDLDDLDDDDPDIAPLPSSAPPTRGTPRAPDKCDPFASPAACRDTPPSR